MTIRAQVLEWNLYSVKVIFLFRRFDKIDIVFSLKTVKSGVMERERKISEWLIEVEKVESRNYSKFVTTP